jgi:hypothetical protein
LSGRGFLSSVRVGATRSTRTRRGKGPRSVPRQQDSAPEDPARHPQGDRADRGAISRAYDVGPAMAKTVARPLGFLSADPCTRAGHRHAGRRWHAARPGTLGPARRARSRASRTSPRRRDQPAVPRPPDTRSPPFLRTPIQHVVGRPCSAWISPVLGTPLLRARAVRSRHRTLARPLGDAVPEGVQRADLLGFREVADACSARARSSPFLSAAQPTSSTVFPSCPGISHAKRRGPSAGCAPGRAIKGLKGVKGVKGVKGLTGGCPGASWSSTIRPHRASRLAD